MLYVLDSDGKKRLHSVAFESKELSPTNNAILINNEYLIVAVDCATSTGVVFALPERLANAVIELLEELIGT